MTGERWVEVTPSQFPHEIEGLHYLKSKLPTISPYRAWTNFEFLDSHGRWHEVDALVLARGQLHLVELKYYSGTLRGNDTQWLRDGRRAEDSPLLLARRKAQRFASKLKDELKAWAKEKQTSIDERKIVPFVQESVFLHHPSLVCELTGPAALNLYGLDEQEEHSHLPGISDLILEEPRADRLIGQNQEHILAELMSRIGLVQRRERTAGSWIIEEGALDEGDGWQDWRAYHQVAKEETARIRIQVIDPGAGKEERARALRIAEHEYRLMNRLSHDGLLKPMDLVESDLGIGLVYPFDESMQRLDLWMAGRKGGVRLSDQLSIVEQVGDAIDYAHRNGIVHRGLSPKTVWIGTAHDRLRVLISDWQTAGAAREATALAGDDGVTRLFGGAAPVAKPEVDDDAWLIEGFTAPEGRWSSTADRVALDIFGLGALAYYIITGEAPAKTGLALTDRLREQGGLDIAPVLPQVGESLRTAVLDATRPVPGDRPRSVQEFLNTLDAATSEPETTEETDPLDATAGTVLGNRFTVIRRLGRGSTALGLLVRDALADGTEVERVLKVALNDKAAARLTDEAEVISLLTGPRLAAMAEGPFDVNGRTALLLESAGSQTLDELIRERGGRLSIDLLERFGTDLLQAITALDKAGIDHRDIKPSNLGVREDNRKAKHLVLFDFSLSRAPATALEAGTPPYLDPFLGRDRPRFDTAAERYAAAVVLYEMATGRRPYYGDPLANPAAVPDDVTVDPRIFDQSVAPTLAEFFRTALTRDASQRHHTSSEMLAVWRSAFSSETTTAPAEADELAAKADIGTSLDATGLSARALSALEPFGVKTVGDLVAVDAVRLNRLSGVAEATRREVKGRAKQWRERFGTRSSAPHRDSPPSLQEIATLLTNTVTTTRSPNRGKIVNFIFGREGDLEAFATQAQLAAAFPQPVSPGRANQILDDIHKGWAGTERTKNILQSLGDAVDGRLKAGGGVAGVAELAQTLRLECAEDDAREDVARRLSEGLLRIIVDRRRAQIRGGDGEPLEMRRRDGRPLAIARNSALLDLAETLGSDADRILATSSYGEHLVPAERASAPLLRTVTAAGFETPVFAEDARVVRLAAAMSQTASATGAAELYRRDLNQATAVGLALRGIGAGERLGVKEIQNRVRARFPALADLPRRPGLDTLLERANLDLKFDPSAQLYYSPSVGADTTGVQSHIPTVLAPETDDDGGPVSRRLEDSARRRSFLTLGTRADRVTRLITVLEHGYHAQVLDLTGILMDEMKRLSAEPSMPPWELLVRADAQPPDSRGGRGLAAVVARAMPVVENAITEALARPDADGHPCPVLLTEASPVVRYGHAQVLRRLSDLAIPRGQAVWLVVPQLSSSQGPQLDGVPIQTSPNQFVRISHEWVDARDRALQPSASAEGAPE